jgi:hypothetical protein
VTGFGLFLAGTIICLKQLGLTQLAGREPHIWRVISQNAPYMAVRMVRLGPNCVTSKLLPYTLVVSAKGISELLKIFGDQSKFSKSINFQEISIKKSFHEEASPLVWSLAFPFPSRLRTQAKNIPKFPLLH